MFTFPPQAADRQGTLTPAKLNLFADVGIPSLSPTPPAYSLPPVRGGGGGGLSGFQRRHSSPSFSADEIEETITELSPVPRTPAAAQHRGLSPSSSPHKNASPPSLAVPTASPSPNSSPCSPTPPAGRPASGELHLWRRGSDRPKTSVSGKKPSYGVATLAGRCPGMYKENQDNFFVYEHAENKDMVAGVLDGHGIHGRQVSTFVQDHLAKNILKTSTGAAAPQELPTPRRLEHAFVETAKSLSGTGIDVRQSGTTAVAVVRKGEDLYIANVGDSRCVLAREDHSGVKAMPLSKDHKPDAASERDRIAKAGGFVEPTLVGNSFQGPHRVWRRRQVDGGLAISRSIGDTALESAGVVPQPDVLKVPVTPHDKFLVMASDGVWDQLSNEQVVAIASMHDDPRSASSAIVKEARRRWERDGAYVDDITAMVIKM